MDNITNYIIGGVIALVVLVILGIIAKKKKAKNKDQ